jgi:arylsulfatase A-like enzyme
MSHHKTNRRVILFSFVVVLSLWAVNHRGHANVPSSSQRAGAPNIILIIGDDLDANPIAFMPNLQALLVAQGTSFANYFVNVSLCCPSRASMLRGQYAHNHQVLTNRSPNGGYERFRDLGHESSTVAAWLQGAGYRTVLIGKYLNGYPDHDSTYVPPGWDEWYGVIKGHYINYDVNENGRVVEYGTAPEEYETDVQAQKALDFIRRAAGAQPFFIYLAPYAPHGPARPAQRHRSAFPDAVAPRPPSFNEQDLSDKPAWMRSLPLLTDSDIADIDVRYRERLQSLLAVDEMIKSLVDTLAAMQQLDNTYIFFTSDNGYQLGEHRRKLTKNTAYDGDIRVPLIVRGPGVPAGAVIEHMGVNIDLAPTFADLAGASAPDFVDGVSLVPLLGSSQPALKDWRQALIVEHWRSPSDEDVVPEYHALRTIDYLYVEYDTGEREMYDRRRDPYELQSLHETAAPELLDELASQLAILRECSGAGCLITTVDDQPHPPEDFVLLQNYPNPFNPRTLIRFTLPKNAQVTLKIFDVYGQEAMTLVNEKLLAGEHRVVFDAAGLASGIYFYKIQSSRFSQTRKALMLK